MERAPEKGSESDTVFKVMHPWPTHTDPEIYFTDPQGGSQTNQVDNIAYLTQWLNEGYILQK